VSTYEASITNPKKQLEFYKILSEQLQQENKQLKEEMNKISKKEIKVIEMLYSIEYGTLTRERIMQIEEILFEIGSENNE
jgi:hypothetical protein